MNFLLTGGAGSVGRDLTKSLLKKGHRVRVLDKDTESLKAVPDGKLELIEGMLEDRKLVQGALKGIDTVVHLAWSFSDDPVVLVESDLKGHVFLLEASVEAKVSRFFYSGTAVVYGKAASAPITEETPCLVEDARKPFYAVAKLAAEKLAFAYGKVKGLPATVFRFWWSFGEVIGGRHLRDMIDTARKGEPLGVPEGAGGSFLDHADLANGLLLALPKKETIGQIFNLSTLYLQWSDIARMIIEVCDSPSPVEVIPAKEWKGAPFLADAWELSTAKAEQFFGFRSLFSPSEARQRLKRAITQCRADMEKRL
jgi:UDP-glucose 4-epimerase